MSARVLSLMVTILAAAPYPLTQKAMPEGVRPAPLFAFCMVGAGMVAR